MEKLLQAMVGKTIAQADASDAYLVLTFTDGTRLSLQQADITRLQALGPPCYLDPQDPYLQGLDDAAV